MRLNGIERRRIKREHSITDVLSRMGIALPPYWDGSSDYRIRAGSLGLPHGPDDSQGVLIKPAERRWWAFHGGFGGDVLDLVRHVTAAETLAEAASILDSLQPIAVVRGDHDQEIDTAAVLGWSERPALARTPVRRVLQVNDAAWQYLTLPKLAERARAYLRYRGIDVTDLEAETDRPVAGHTPFRRTGLVDFLRVRGFTDDEIVDSGWGVRRPDLPLRDRYHHRVLLPFRDEAGRLLGVTGRDITTTAAAKYLNHPRTVVFDKSAVLYRPSAPYLDLQASVVVCEGTLDALAIASTAARAGASHRFAPVTQSGLTLTDRVAPRVFGIHPRPIVLCGDGDCAGQQATAAWVRRVIRVYHREVLTVTLPDGLDPADWLAREGDAGLLAFARPGCLSDREHIRPRPAGGLLARHELNRALGSAAVQDRDVEAVIVARRVTDRLGNYAAQLLDPGAVQRFAREAGATLAHLVDGLDTDARTQQVLDSARRHHGFQDIAADRQTGREAVMTR